MDENRNEETVVTYGELKDVVNQHSKTFKKLNEVLKDYRNRLQTSENEIRKLHNMVRDLQKNNGPDLGKAFGDIFSGQ